MSTVPDTIVFPRLARQHDPYSSADRSMAPSSPQPTVHRLASPIQPDEVETPAAVVDLDRASRNAARVVGYLASHGLAWRPHVKTHKSRTMAKIQLAAGAAGLTVATLKEAEAMAPLGADLLLAYPPVGRAKGRRLARFLDDTPLTVALDSSEALATTADAARQAGREVPLLVEIDVGMGRVGVRDPAAARSLALEASDRAGVRFGGVLFYPGHIRSPADEQDQALGSVAACLADVLETLESAGLEPEVVSGGSSPTLWRSHELPGLTEVRAGTCIFHDRDMVGLGVCDEGDVAYRVLATVISDAIPGQVVVDAGSKALSREEFRGEGAGYAVVHGHPDVVVRSVSEEHGILDLSRTEWRPRVGARIELIPNHVCVSVNLQDRLLARDPEGFREIALEGRGRLP